MPKKHSSSSLRRMPLHKAIRIRAARRARALRARSASCDEGKIRSPRTGRCRSPKRARMSRRRHSLGRAGLLKRKSSIRRMSPSQKRLRRNAMARRRYRSIQRAKGKRVRSR